LRPCGVAFLFPITFNRPFCRCEAPRPREHLTVNQVVAGSSPAFGAKTKRPSNDGLFVLLSVYWLSLSSKLLDSQMLSRMS